MADRIQDGFEVFLADGDTAFGAVVRSTLSELVIYVENAGEFNVSRDAVKAVHSQKVIVDVHKLDHRLRRAIGHAHDAEDPNA